MREVFTHVVIVRNFGGFRQFYKMKCISLVCMLCLLHLASAVCECSNGQQSVIPSIINLNSPSPFNGTNGSPSSFGSGCTERGSLLQCNGNTDNPLFNCSASNNSYYGWDSGVHVSLTFSNHYQSVNILVTFLISTSSNVSVPMSLQYAAFDDGQDLPAEPVIHLPNNLSDGSYQHNYTLSPDMMFNNLVITIPSNTTLPWVAINRIILCPVTTEDQSSSTMSSSAPVTLSTMSTPDETVTSSVPNMSSTPTISSAVSPNMYSTMSPTMSSAVSPNMSSTMSPTIFSTMSPVVSTTSPVTSTMSSNVSPSVSTTAGGTSSSDDSALPITLLIIVIVIAIVLFLVVLVLVIVLCYICRRKSKSKAYSVQGTTNVTTVPEGYEMFTADTLPATITNGVTDEMKKNDYDYPQLPMDIEISNHIDDPNYSTPECKESKTNRKGSSSTLPTTFARSDIDIALYETPSLAPTCSKASFNKVIENGEPVYYMLDKKYSFYEKSKSLNALEDVDLQPYSSIYDDPQPLTKSEAPNYVKPTDIKEIKLLGDGQFGEVYLAEVVGLSASAFDGIDPSNGSPLQVAVKRLRGNPSEGMQQAFKKEIKFMSRLKHKHVIRLLGICTDASQPFIMIEYAKNGDLNRYLKSMKLAEGNLPPSKSEVTKLGLLSQCTQIASGMEYLSSLNFIHRDLATRNILVGDWNQVKIADFGMSQNLYDSDYYRVKGHAIVPIRWMATECFYGRFSVKSDVWAFGVVVWEVFTMCLQRPYEEMTDAELIQNARYAEKRKLLQQTEHCPDQLYQLLLQCWKSSPADRPNFSQLYDQFTKLSNGSV